MEFRLAKLHLLRRSRRGPGGTRTHTLRIKSPLLCHWSYRPVRRPSLGRRCDWRSGSIHRSTLAGADWSLVARRPAVASQQWTWSQLGTPRLPQFFLTALTYGMHIRTLAQTTPTALSARSRHCLRNSKKQATSALFSFRAWNQTGTRLRTIASSRRRRTRTGS